MLRSRHSDINDHPTRLGITDDEVDQEFERFSFRLMKPITYLEGWVHLKDISVVLVLQSSSQEQSLLTGPGRVKQLPCWISTRWREGQKGGIQCCVDFQLQSK